MKNLILLLSALFLISGCSSAKKKDSSAVAVDASSSDDNNTPGAITKVQTSKSIKVNFNSNEMITKISEYIAQNPESTLKKVVSFANSLKNDIGLPFTLVAGNAEIVGTETYITAENGKRLNVGIGSEPLCASGIAVTYPVTRRDGDTWFVHYSSGEYSIKAQPIRVGEIRRNKDGKVESKIALPEEGTEPGGIDKSGESLFVRFDLNPAASSWWQRVMKRNPKEEKPFLVLEMGESDFEFSDDSDNYDNFDDSPPREASEDDNYILKFEDSNYFFRSMSCG